MYSHKDWFQNIVPAAVSSGEISQIAILRLDGDLYESTRVCLEWLYPLVASRGFAIIDDDGLKGCRLAVDEFLSKLRPRPFLHFVDANVHYFQKP